MSWNAMATQLNRAAPYVTQDEHRAVVLEIAQRLPEMEMLASPALAVGSSFVWRQHINNARDAEQSLRQGVEGLKGCELHGVSEFEELTPELREYMVMKATRQIAQVCDYYVQVKMHQGMAMIRVRALPKKIAYIASWAFVIPAIISCTSILWNWPSRSWVIALIYTLDCAAAIGLSGYCASLARVSLNEAGMLTQSMHACSMEAAHLLVKALQVDMDSVKATHY